MLDKGLFSPVNTAANHVGTVFVPNWDEPVPALCVRFTMVRWKK